MKNNKTKPNNKQYLMATMITIGMVWMLSSFYILSFFEPKTNTTFQWILLSIIFYWLVYVNFNLYHIFRYEYKKPTLTEVGDKQ